MHKEIDKAFSIHVLTALCFIAHFATHPVQLISVLRLDGLAKPPSWITRKLMIFRPVTADGSPYGGN